jgi:hypothetical protein
MTMSFASRGSRFCATFAVAFLPLAASCSPTLPPPALDPSSAPAEKTEQCQLLLFPEADAESLLGRAVQRSADGSWTMADTRAPGCDVSVKREAASFHTSRTVGAHSMTSLAGGYAKVVSLEAKFGRENTLNVEVDNSSVVTGNLVGACGELVVDKVFVGHGRRRAAASAEEGGGAGANAGLANAAAKVEADRSQADALEWANDQAYGFTVRQNEKVEPLDLTVRIPSILNEGEEVEVRVEAARPAWLVAYYIDAAGHADVLWPSNEEPEPYVGPGQPAVMPSDRQKAKGFHIRASLLKPGEPSRETLVVYGFADKRDFDVRKPAAGAGNADGPSYAAALTKELQNIPMNRWSRAVVGYVIQPKAGGQEL